MRIRHVEQSAGSLCPRIRHGGGRKYDFAANRVANIASLPNLKSACRIRKATIAGVVRPRFITTQRLRTRSSTIPET